MKVDLIIFDSFQMRHIYIIYIYMDMLGLSYPFMLCPVYIIYSFIYSESRAQNLRQGILLKTSFKTRVSRMGSGSFVDMNSFVVLKEQRPTLDDVMSPLKEQRTTLKGVRSSWKEGGRRKPKKDVCPPKIGTIVKYLELIPQLDGGCTPDIHVPTPGTLGTLFQAEPEFKLDKEEQESDPKPPLPPPNLINPIFGYCQDKNCSLCPTKSTVKIGEFFTCFPQKGDSRASCQLIHWHSKNNQCLQATEDDFK